MPERVKPRSAPTRLPSPSQRRWDSSAIGISLTSRPMTRTQPQLRPDCSWPTWPFSQTATEIPFSARNSAVVMPMMPPPITTMSTFSGMSGEGSNGSMTMGNA